MITLQCTLDHLIREATHALRPLSSTPRLEAQYLLCHVLQVPESYVYANPEATVTDAQEEEFNRLLARRVSGEPLAYILGTHPFWDVNLKVTPDVLIPRADTEKLVECALQRLDPIEPLVIVDAGTGSGAVAIALSRACPKWRITAIEKSLTAVKIAQENAARFAPDVVVKSGDWLHGIEAKSLDAVVSNPPYIELGDPDLMPDVLKYEPTTALFANKQGLADIETLVQQSAVCLKPGGFLAVEHGHKQAAEVRALFTSYGFVSVLTQHDLNGRDRVTCGYLG